MDVALVKDAENDVDSDDCCRDQIRLRAKPERPVPSPES
jgi:hypothetical protein